MSIQELYASHPKPWTNVHCYSLTTDNLQVNHVQDANSALFRAPVYSALPPVPDAGHYGYYNGEVYYSDGSNWIKTDGNISGPILSTDNAIARFDGITGEQLQNSGVILNDTNDISGINDLRTTRLTFNGINFKNSLLPSWITCKKTTTQLMINTFDTNIINYNIITGNITGSFNGTTGIFTVPSSGIYIVTSTLYFDNNLLPEGFRTSNINISGGSTVSSSLFIPYEYYLQILNNGYQINNITTSYFTVGQTINLSCYNYNNQSADETLLSCTFSISTVGMFN
jgi:hypothetical protein